MESWKKEDEGIKIKGVERGEEREWEMTTTAQWNNKKA